MLSYTHSRFLLLAFIPALVMAQAPQTGRRLSDTEVAVPMHSEPKRNLTQGETQFEPNLSTVAREGLLTQASILISLRKLPEAEAKLARINSRPIETASWHIFNAALLLPIALDYQEKKRTSYAREIARYIRDQLNLAEGYIVNEPEAQEAIARYRAVLSEKILGTSQEAAEELKKAKQAETQGRLKQENKK